MNAFYLGILPAGIAVLFVLVQCSPNPAHGIGQAIECLLALAALCLSVTLPVSLLVMLKSVRRAVADGRALWLLVGITASFFLLRDLLEFQGSFPFSDLTLAALEFGSGCSFAHIELVAGIVLASVTAIGLMLRWGPIVPSALLGIIAIKLFLFAFVEPSCVAYESRVAYQFAINNDMAVLLFGMIGGACAGMILDSQRHRVADTVPPPQTDGDASDVEHTARPPDG
ncbi:MAG: hypothetical protein ABFC63_07035 [Thermoguttaceae bacterium]